MANIDAGHPGRRRLSGSGNDRALDRAARAILTTDTRIKVEHQDR